MVNGPLFGIGLAGGVQQANEMARQDIAQRSLDLQEQQFRSQEMAQQRAQVFETAENLINNLVEAKKASGLSGEEFNQRAAQSIERAQASLTRTSELAAANGIQVPDFGQQLQERLSLTQTAGEAAVTRGQTQATERVAEAETLVSFGIPTAQALQTAGVPAADVPRFQTEAGKTIGDLQLATEMFGEDSPQAQALAEVLQGLQAGETQVDLTQVSGLRKEFTKASQDFVGSQDAFDRVKFAAENESAAGDVALIFGFMKMLDPNSTVREGEFATAQQAAGVPQQVLGLYNRAINGQRLTASQREDFFNQSKGIYVNQLRRQIEREQEFTRLSDSSGLPSDLVVVNFRQNVTPEDIQFASSPTTATETAEPMRNNGTDQELPAFDAEILGRPLDRITREEILRLSPEGQRRFREKVQSGN